MRRSRKVKILATLGPATAHKAAISDLVQVGADLFRINMSHTSPGTLPYSSVRVTIPLSLRLNQDII